MSEKDRLHAARKYLADNDRKYRDLEKRQPGPIATPKGHPDNLAAERARKIAAEQRKYEADVEYLQNLTDFFKAMFVDVRQCHGVFYGTRGAEVRTHLSLEMREFNAIGDRIRKWVGK